MNKKIKLTPKEESIMTIVWKHGALFVKEVIAYLNEDPQPQYNTVATFVKGLEARGCFRVSSLAIRIAISRSFPKILTVIRV